MASGVLIANGRVARLERETRLAGEAFGHEEPASLTRLGQAGYLPSRWLVPLFSGFAAIAGLLARGVR